MSPAFDGDVLVVGLGAAGAATLYQLARRGARVAGIDRFRPPHTLGSSHGESRITRLAVGEGAAYVPLVRRSHEIWRELQQHSGEAIYTDCGGLVLAATDAAPAPEGRTDFYHRTLALAQANGIRHEQLGAAEVQRRFPALQLQGSEEAYFEPEAGFVRPELAITTQLRQAAALGAGLHLEETLLDVQPHGQRLQVVTETVNAGNGSQRRVHRADRVVLALGPWLPQFLAPRSAVPVPLRVLRQVMYWFDVPAADAARYRPGAMPVFIWAFGNGEQDSFYGFPAADPAQPRVKMATAQWRETTTPETVQRQVAPAEVQAFVDSRVHTRLAFRAEDCSDARACLYTATPDHRFIVDALPGLDAVTVVSACSGHGFKHSAGLGDAVAERLLGRSAGGSAIDLAPFAWTPPP